MILHAVTFMEPTDWKSTPIYMMDFEGSPSSGVVEYGVVLLHHGEIQEVRTALCHPVGTILPRDQVVHGLGTEETRSQPRFCETYATFVEWRRRGVFAAHNRHAENSFLKSTWALPPAVPDWRSGLGLSQEWGPWIDTLSLYRALYPNLASYGLGDLVSLFSLQPELESIANPVCPETRCRPHCALFDALASSLLLLRLEKEEVLTGQMTVGWLLGLSEGRDTQQELF